MTLARARWAAATAAAALAVTLAACGSSSGGSSTSPAGLGGANASTPSPATTELSPTGDIPDNQAYVTFSPAGGVYALSVPEGWASTGSGSSASFTDKLNSIDVRVSTSPAAPSVATASGVDVAALRSSVPQFQLVKVESFTRSAGTGTLIRYLADSQPDPVTGKVVRDAVERYAFWRNGQLVVLTLTGPQGADNVDPWTKVTNSFRWTK